MSKFGSKLGHILLDSVETQSLAAELGPSRSRTQTLTATRPAAPEAEGEDFEEST